MATTEHNQSQTPLSEDVVTFQDTTRTRRRMQFSLRTLLVLALVSSLLLGWVRNRLNSFRKQQAVVDRYELMGARIVYHQEGYQQMLWQSIGAPGEYNGDVYSVDFLDTQATDDDLQYLAALPRLEAVVFMKTPVTRHGVDWVTTTLPDVQVFASPHQREPASYRLRVLPRAEYDAQHIFDRMSEHSPQEANAWRTAFESFTTHVLDNPTVFGVN